MTATSATDSTPRSGVGPAPASRRVALVCDWCLPRFGGLELQLIDLATSLRAAGNSVEIITATPGPPSLSGITVHRLSGFRFPYFGFSASLRQFREFRALLRTGGFDVVHVHSGIIAPLAYGTAAIAAKSGIPTALTFHSVYDYLAPALTALARISGATRFPIAWSAVSGHVARETSRALSDAQVDILPNGIDPNAWATPPHERRSDTFRLVAVMRLQVRKRPRDLFTILENAQRQLGSAARVTLDIVGDGPERRAVERRAAQAGADRVRVHGRRTRDEIRELFAEADAFVLPTRMESFGIAALEALCAGVPVIARSDTGVQDFVKHGENGLLADSVAGLTAAAVELARNEPLRSSIARRNHAARPPYAWSDVVTATLAQYARAESLQRQLGNAQCASSTVPTST
ncbi:MAG TPA: glycosyltransferase family 4 protein [Gemmatimonadaceae bacterium]|nr:glycosyltransferase family 4 protein [Gemmatimonadaceae bacterium]